MKKIIILLAILLFIFISCSDDINKKSNNKDKNSQDNKQKMENKTNNTDNKTENKEKQDSIIEQINKMSIDEKVGQMVIAGMEGYTIDDKIKTLVTNDKIGGLIFYDRNVKNQKQLTELVSSLKEINIKNVPLFFSIDEEGGRISRMPNEIDRLPSNYQIGKLNDVKVAYIFGETVGSMLKYFNLNMDFAPVIDINNNPDNPVIGDRAFGAQSELVSNLGVKVMQGIQSKGVISVVKHFPGHGDTSVDSHKALPVIDKSLESIMSFELIPFINAIKNNTDCIMTAHILLPQIDKENPASCSKIIITDILRNKLGFDGVVITDDITMEAISDNYNSIGNAAVGAINAGSDIVLVAHSYENANTVLSVLKEAVKNGSISEDRINKSVYRILKLKDKYKIGNDIAYTGNLQEINQKIKEINNSVNGN